MIAASLNALTARVEALEARTPGSAWPVGIVRRDTVVAEARDVAI
jgi:hypothetical protein